MRSVYPAYFHFVIIHFKTSPRENIPGAAGVRTGKRRKFHFALHGVYMIISPKAENNAQKTHRNKLAEKSGSSDFVKAPAPCTRKDIAAARYFIASSIFSMKIPYPRVGSDIRTCVTAPTSFPSWMIGLPLIP